MIRAVWVFRHLRIYHPRPAVLNVSGAWSVVKALPGDDNALGNLKDSVIQALGDEELRQFLAKLDANRLGLLARNTVCKGDAESVRALACVGWKQLLDQIGDLFREVYDACSSDCNIDNEQLRLAILKLYHRLV
jgi:hypothetical protein